MRSADPSAIISSGGLSNMDLSFLSRAVDRDIAGIVNAISVHPYPKSGPETIVPAFSSLQFWIANRLGKGIELWDSEWGYSSTLAVGHSALDGHNERDRERQANLAVREILTVWNLGFHLSTWYDLRDDGNDPADRESNFGLLNSRGREKLAMGAVRALNLIAARRQLTGILSDIPAATHALELDGEADTIFIVWCDQTGAIFGLHFDAQEVQGATDMFGNTIPIDAARDQTITLRESDGPVYIRCRLATSHTLAR